jgi:hypothetical protein
VACISHFHKRKKAHRNDASISADLLRLRFPGVYQLCYVACINVRTSLQASQIVSTDAANNFDDPFYDKTTHYDSRRCCVPCDGVLSRCLAASLQIKKATHFWLALLCLLAVDCLAQFRSAKPPAGHSLASGRLSFGVCRCSRRVQYALLAVSGQSLHLKFF